MTVLAATEWRSNAELIEDVHLLGYIGADDRVLDPTYGRGVWWRRWRPRDLVVHDLAMDGVDFRALPYSDASFDVVAFDPPYVSVGGRRTSGMVDMLGRYGLTDAPRSPSALQDMINSGLAEAARVVRPGGVVLVKCQDYVSSGRLWIGTHWTLSQGIALGLELVDRLEHVGRARPQPSGRRQVHARRNLSTLLVFRR